MCSQPCRRIYKYGGIFLCRWVIVWPKDVVDSDGGMEAIMLNFLWLTGSMNIILLGVGVCTLIRRTCTMFCCRRYEESYRPS